jgi:hypothetical protein
VTGFHKRKKKRRKEANKITEEKERRKRIEARKKVRSSQTRLCFPVFLCFFGSSICVVIDDKKVNDDKPKLLEKID